MADPRRAKGLTNRLLSKPAGMTVIDKHGPLKSNTGHVIGVQKSKDFLSTPPDVSDLESIKKFIEQLQSQLKDLFGPIARFPFLDGTYHRDVYIPAAFSLVNVLHRLKTKEVACFFANPRSLVPGTLAVMHFESADDIRAVISANVECTTDVWCVPRPRGA